MKAEKESKVIAEVRRIRRQLQEEARRVGHRKYHEHLNRRQDHRLGKKTDTEYRDTPALAGFEVNEEPKQEYGKE